MILVTGATGTTGVEVVRALDELGVYPRVLARDTDKAARLLGDQVEITRGDFADAASIEAALEGVERAFLLTNPAPDMVAVQKMFIDAAQRAGVKHVVKLSAVGARPGSPARFSRWHGEAEQYLESSGLEWTHLRPNFFMQNLPTLAGMVKGGTLYMPTGQGKAPFVDVRDIAAVAAHVLTEDGHEGKAYDVTGPEAIGYADIAAAFTTLLGRPISYVDVPAAAAKQSMTTAGVPDWLADALNELNEQMRLGNYSQTSDVVRTIGQKEPISIEHYIRENAALFS